MKKAHNKMDVVEMRMLRWMFGVIKQDRGNERIIGTIKVGEVFKKVQKSTYMWHGHVMRREEGYVCKR